jgi:glycosyltransferase involved in cell wall biosynthesis
LKKRLLIAHPVFGAFGGGNGVAAWAIEALRDTYDISLATLWTPDCPAVNRTFGTSLRDSDFAVHLAPPSYHRLMRALPTQGSLLETCLTMRLAQEVDRKEHFDVLLGTQNEIDFGRRGIHYVHHPWVFLPRPEFEMLWYHYIPGMLTGYRMLCAKIARSSNAGLRRNLSLVNSDFIARRVRETHGVESMILYPPVPGGFPEVAWEKRQRGFVALGRIHEHKRWDMAIAIIEEVRRRGHDVTFTLIGSRDSPECHARMAALAAERPWFRMLNDLSREELAATVAGHRYGIHTMLEEHFGIGPAEMQRAGCIVFVHNSGGLIEIVGGNPRLLFDNVQEAADKIERVLTDPACEEALRRHVAAQRDRFSAEMFCSSLREIVAGFRE